MSEKELEKRDKIALREYGFAERLRESYFTNSWVATSIILPVSFGLVGLSYTEPVVHLHGLQLLPLAFGAHLKKLQIKGTMILKTKGNYLKVITITPVGGNQHVFDCRGLESGRSEVLKVGLLGLHEALDKATPFMKDPKDILLMSLDKEDNGLWKVIPKEQIEKLEKELKTKSSLKLRDFLGQ
jgi:hypothetical protein